MILLLTAGTCGFRNAVPNWINNEMKKEQYSKTTDYVTTDKRFSSTYSERIRHDSPKRQQIESARKNKSDTIQNGLSYL